MKVKVIREECIGCGLCADLCPEVFKMDDDGLAVAVDGEVPEDMIKCAEEAKDSCPTEAIVEK